MSVNELKAGATLNYIILGLNALLGLVYTPFMLRMLGQSEYGIYSLAASVIAYLSILDLGFGNAVIRYTAKFRAEGKLEEQYSLFGMFTLFYAIIGLLVLCIGLVLYFNVGNLFGKTLSIAEIQQTKTIILLMVFNLAITFPLSIYGAIITAYENFIFLRILQIFRLLLTTIVMICLLKLGYKAVALVIAQTFFKVLSLSLYLLLQFN
uniref:lipopolysaccharide biosynthesis protein n=1 Tax=Butyricimonas virosa TaxID=544645 RepID=UPI00402617D0